MAVLYYSLPFNPSKLIRNEEHDKVDIQQSIASFLHLLSTTHFGECTFDDSFGNALWEIDFDNFTSNDKLRAIISESLLNSIERYETRLSHVTIEIKLRQENTGVKTKSINVRKRIDVIINGTIDQTDEPFSFIEGFYIAPISF